MTSFEGLSLIDIDKQLTKIISSPDFQASERLKKLLCYLVEERLSGRAEFIKAYTIATSFFGKRIDFDPQVDPIVRVEVGKLRSKLESYYFRQKNDIIRIDIPKGRYIVTFKVIKNSKQEKEVKNQIDNSDVALSLSLEQQKYYQVANYKEAVSKFINCENSDKSSKLELRPSIGVLPFINISQGKKTDIFINGLVQDISVALNKFGDLTVADSFVLKEFCKDSYNIIGIANYFSIRFILHGSVQMQGQILRVSATLTDSKTATNLWAEKFEDKISNLNLFKFQDQICSKIVAILADNFGLIKRTLFKESCNKGLDDLELHEALLRYDSWIASFDQQLFKQAKSALEHALKLEPDYPVALAMLSDMYASDYQQGYNQVFEPLENSMLLAKKALAFDANCQIAYWALAQNYFLRREKKLFEETIQKILPLNSVNPYMNVSTGILIAMTGNLELGQERMSRAIQLNPYSPSWYHIVPCFIAYNQNDYEKALVEALQINTLGTFWDPMFRAAVYGKLGYKKEGKQALNELFVLQPEFKNRWLSLMRALLFSDNFVKKILSGLVEAGLLFNSEKFID